MFAFDRIDAKRDTIAPEFWKKYLRPRCLHFFYTHPVIWNDNNAKTERLQAQMASKESKTMETLVKPSFLLPKIPQNASALWCLFSKTKFWKIWNKRIGYICLLLQSPLLKSEPIMGTLVTRHHHNYHEQVRNFLPLWFNSEHKMVKQYFTTRPSESWTSHFQRDVSWHHTASMQWKVSCLFIL